MCPWIHRFQAPATISRKKTSVLQHKWQRNPRLTLKRERNGEGGKPNRGISLFGIQAQVSIWTGMVSSCVWWKIGPFPAAHFGCLACWLYHLGITGLSDVFPRVSPRACAHPYPSAEAAGPGAWIAPTSLPWPSPPSLRRLSWTPASIPPPCFWNTLH